MTTIRKVGLVSVFAVLGLCLLGVLFVVFEKDIYKWWVNQSTTKPSIFYVDISHRTAIQVYPNPNGINWSGTRWTDDGQYVEVYSSRGQIYANTLMVINPQNPSITNDTQLLEGENILGLTYVLPFTLEDRESLWTGCKKENLFFTGKYVESNLWETRLWKGNELVKTFQPIELHFDLYQSGFNDSPVGWIIEYSHFSSDCRYSTFTFGKEVWLLDTVEESFLPIFTARQFHNNLSDFVEGNHQWVVPSWAPNSQEFVFGDKVYGLEKYNVQSKKRSWFLPPDIAFGINGVIKWSISGKWILARSEKGLVIISSTGERMGVLGENCKSIESVVWSSNDKIAFICKDYNSVTCVEGKCPDEKNYLVVWDLSNLDGN
jgi:hypothetical protein